MHGPHNLALCIRISNIKIGGFLPERFLAALWHLVTMDDVLYMYEYTTGGGCGLACGAVMDSERGGGREGRPRPPPQGFGNRLVTTGSVSVIFLKK